MSVLTPVTANYWDNNGVALAKGSGANAYFARTGCSRIVIGTSPNFDGNMAFDIVAQASNYQWDAALTIYRGAGPSAVYEQIAPANLITVAAGVKQTMFVHGLPTGSQLFEVQVGNAIPGDNICNIQTVTVHGALMPVTAPAKQLTIYGDSLTMGTNGGPPVGTTCGRSQGFAMQLRHGSSYQGVTTLGANGLAWFNLANSGASIANWITEISTSFVGTALNKMLVLFGTNDYGGTGGLWTPSAMETGILGALDAYHVAFPGQQILIGTTFTEVYTGNNSFGFNKAAYDSAILAAAAARPAFCTGIDLTSTVSLSNMTAYGGDNSIHFGTLGHGQVYTALDAVI